MTGPEHYQKAEEHLAFAAGIETDGDQDSMSAWHQRQAQAHATLALAAATAPPGEHPGDRQREIWAFGLEAGPEPGGRGGMFAPQAACGKCGAPIRRSTSGRWFATDRFDGLDANPCEHEPAPEVTG